MQHKMTLGRFYPAGSVIHCLDPRTKLTALTVCLVTVFASGNIVELIPSLCATLALILISKIPVKYMFQGLRNIVIVTLVADLLSILTEKTNAAGIALTTLKIYQLLVLSNLLTITTRIKDITAGLEKALGFLKKFKVPVHDLATVVSIVLRFIPILVNEADRILLAQKARGADFKSKNLAGKAKTLVSLLVPMFVSAFRKADCLSLSMDSRLYESNNETTMLHPLKYTVKDVKALIVILLYISVCVIISPLQRLLLC